MRILICDDSAPMVELLQKYIAEFFSRNQIKCPEIACFSDGESLLCDGGKKDVLFLDVEMPGMNGIYVGNELKKQNKNCIIIVVTSFAEYLDEAMRFHVFRYLSKPLDKARFFRCLKDAMQLYTNSTLKVAVETRDGVYTVPVSEIICVQAQARKVIIHTLQRDLFSTRNIQYWAKTLPDSCFFQTHRSFLVNMEHVTEFDHTLIHLASYQLDAYLTRRKYTDFKNAYLLYLEATQ